jgi:3-oxoadipate enol-lactonase
VSDINDKARYLDAGAGPRTIVFLHGVGTDADSWAMQIAFFARRYRTVAWNLPGYGGTPALPAPLDFGDIADTLKALVDRLRLSPVDLVGHSFGGMVALEFAARYPDLLRTLTLFATSPAFGRPDGDWQQKFVQERLAPIEAGKSMAELAIDMVRSITGPGPDRAGMQLARKSVGQVPTETFANGVRAIVTFDRRDVLPNIAVPTLVLAGALDTNAPATMMQKMALKIPTSQYVCMPGVGHLGNLENPRAFNEALDNFLAAN